MSSPVLPLFHLRRGQHHVEVFDPRPDPRTLGARYVHGGYIASWSVGERCLTSGPTRYWNEFGGRGLPETFEIPLAWAVAKEHENFLRIGAGQLRKNGYNGDDQSARAALTATVDWAVVSHDDEHITMRTMDGTEIGQAVIRYELERTVRILDDGVESITKLTLRCPRLLHHPIGWFAHPFFAQSTLDATAATIPDAEIVTSTPQNPMWKPGTVSLTRQADGRWRFGTGGYNRSTLANLWGTTPTITVDLDPALGGGQVAIAVNRPLDHLVVWGAGHVFSPEPKLSRLWLDGETASWAVRYRFTSS